MNYEDYPLAGVDTPATWMARRKQQQEEARRSGLTPFLEVQTAPGSRAEFLLLLPHREGLLAMLQVSSSEHDAKPAVGVQRFSPRELLALAWALFRLGSAAIWGQARRRLRDQDG